MLSYERAEDWFVRLAARIWGEEGRPLAVLVHGLAASSLTWWRVGPWFANNGWRAVAVDLRGHGQSARMLGSEGLSDLAEDLHETVSGLLGAGGKVDVVVGHSLGALVAAEACRTHGDLKIAKEELPFSVWEAIWYWIRSFFTTNPRCETACHWFVSWRRCPGDPTWYWNGFCWGI
jgi:pimeloyl-ACP methyl ester carboxylesterase